VELLELPEQFHRTKKESVAKKPKHKQRKVLVERDRLRFLAFKRLAAKRAKRAERRYKNGDER